jgi:hypothetical protein
MDPEVDQAMQHLDEVLSSVTTSADDQERILVSFERLAVALQWDGFATSGFARKSLPQTRQKGGRTAGAEG